MPSRRRSVSKKKRNVLTGDEILNIIKHKLRDFKHTFTAIALLKRVKVLEDTSCWIINRDWSEYTSFNKERAHRLSYKLFIGDVVNKLYVCHKCDRKGCINYDHLFQGTASNNQKDWRNKKEAYLYNRQQELLALREATGKAYKSNKVVESWRKISEL